MTWEAEKRLIYTFCQNTFVIPTTIQGTIHQKKLTEEQPLKRKRKNGCTTDVETQVTLLRPQINLRPGVLRSSAL